MKIGRFIKALEYVVLMSVLMACSIKASISQESFFPIFNGVLDRTCSSNEDLHLSLSEELDRFGSKAADDHNLNSLVLEHICWRAVSAHVAAIIGQNLYLIGIEIHQREGGSSSKVLRNCLSHSLISHCGYTDLHLITINFHPFRVVHCYILDSVQLQDHLGLCHHLFPGLGDLAISCLGLCLHMAVPMRV